MDDRIKIFIVEDEALIADEIRRAVTGLGYAVCGICYDYTAAAAAIPDSDADLFMLDINLGEGPARDGIALAGMIRASGATPFIFLTAYSDRDTITQATARHPANYLTKPVNPAMLFAAIQLAIARTGELPRAQPAPQQGPTDFFYVKVGSRTTRLQWQDVYCMEAGKNYVRIYVNGRAGDYPIRGSLAFVLEQLVPEPRRADFFRLGRSCCLNRAHVSAITEAEIHCGGRSFENGGRVSEDQVRTPGRREIG